MWVPGQEAALFAWIPVDREIDEILADSTIVEQRVALPGALYPHTILPWRFASIRNVSSARLVSATRSSNCA